MSMYLKNMFFTSESVTEGRFGRSEFAWEKVDATEELLAGARNT